MNIYFYSLIFLTGILTIYTDIRERKIKNIHLLIICLCACLLYCILLLSGNLKASPHLILNPVAGLIIGFIFYLSGLWKAGDAKLFFTYSLLLPVNYYSTILPLSCFTLFINTFLISFLFLLPLLIYGIIHNKTEMFNKAALKQARLFFGQVFLITLCISWIAQPIMAFFPFKNNIFLTFILLFSGYSIIYKFISLVRNRILIIVMIIAGLTLRYAVMPDFFSFGNIITFLKYTLLYSAIFYILLNIISLKEKKPTRIPFSPFVFLGALLTNTGFLLWIIRRALTLQGL
ncbi:MAG: prepilin peptidase [Candidatus Omnitrophota bacterium]|jgi:Flp pilus assembly protein protease CpaA